MCDPEIIAAILEELGYLEEKKDDKKDEVHERGSDKNNSKTRGEGQQK